MPQANSMEVQNVTGKRSAAGMVWRWRTELGVLIAVTMGFTQCAHQAGVTAAAVIFGGAAALAAGLPWPRRFLAARFRCLLTRHRLQAVFWELRFHTRAYRLPLVLWTRPTLTGERTWVLARAGLCGDDFTKAAAEIAAACVAREARVSVSSRFAALITIDVIRRDVLGPRKVIRSPLAALDVPDYAPAAVSADERPAWPDRGWTEG